MSQSGYTPILTYGSTTASNVPLAANLTTSSSGVELAINAADGKLFYKDNLGVVQVLATKGTGPIGGSNTQVQYNSSGSLAGSANLTFDGTTLTAAGLSGPHNGTVGATTPNTGAFTTLTTSSTVTINGGTANGVAYLNGSKVLTTGSALTFDGSTLGVATTAGNMALFNSTAANGGYLTIQRSGVSKGYIGSAAQLSGGSNDDFTVRAESNLIFSLIASEQMRLTSTGLGIGTSSPGTKLDVNGTARIRAGNTLYFQNATADANGTITASGGAGSSDLAINAGGGNVGIGTSSPAQKLNVATASGNAYMRVERASQTTGQVGLQIGGGTSGTDWLLYQPTSSNDFRLFGNSADRVVVTSAGNVTINAPSSGTALTVTGAVSANGDGSQVAYYLPSGTAVRYTGNGDCYLDYSFGGSSGGLYIRRGPSVSTTVYFDSSGNLTVPAMYGTTVTTPRNVFIDSTGKMGGISSTRASKTNIADLDDVSWLYDLNPVTFNYRKRDEEGRYLDECEDETQYGLIAEDTEPHAPDLCIYDTEGKVSGIHYDRMVTPLLKALHKQKALIEQLTARINALELGNG